MSVTSQVNCYEKQLLSFRQYSFNNYSALQLIAVNLQRLLTDEDILKNTQVKSDLLFEIENEMELLLNLRYSTTKDEDFAIHVNSMLAIIKHVKLYLPVSKTTAGNRQAVNMRDFIKRLFFTDLKHI